MSGAIIAVLIGVTLALVIFGAAIFWLGRLAARRRGLPSPVTPATRVATGSPSTDLAAQANELLLAADDGTRDAQQELGFIEAQFSVLEAKPLREAIDRARVELRAAFQIRQELDDERPEDAGTRRRMLSAIATHSRTAIELVDEQRGKVDRLRDVEAKAPQLLARVPEELTAIEARLPTAEQALLRLQSYAGAVTEPVAGNLPEAKKRLALASAQLEAAQQAIAAGDNRAAGQSAAAAEDASGQAIALLDAVANLEQAVLQASRDLADQLIEARTALASARAAVDEGRVTGLAAKLAEAEERLKAAEALGAGDRPDPISAARQASLAISAAAEVLAGVEEETARTARDRQALDVALRSAEATFAGAADYIGVRRDSVEAEARARLAEAERHLELARSMTEGDPARALANARRAEGLAVAAYNAARADFTLVKTAWGRDETLSAADLLKRFAAGEFGRKRRNRR